MSKISEMIKASQMCKMSKSSRTYKTSITRSTSETTLASSASAVEPFLEGKIIKTNNMSKTSKICRRVGPIRQAGSRVYPQLQWNRLLQLSSFF